MFAIIIEPLAASIRQSSLISPIDMFGHKHYLSLYADDILLDISQPQVSIPPLLTLIDKFGSMSGFSVNWEKSELMPISATVNKVYLQSIPFKKSYKTFIYLGVTITKNPNDLLRLNWQSKIVQAKSNIEFWKTLPKSMVGKMNAIKMIILPRFLHLFLSIPCFI